jgi:hypothetical protein
MSIEKGTGWEAFWLTTLDENAEPYLWELVGDAGNFFPGASAEERATVAERAIRRLLNEGWAQLVTDRGVVPPDEAEAIIAEGSWRDLPPPPTSDARLIATPKWEEWASSARGD